MISRREFLTASAAPILGPGGSSPAEPDSPTAPPVAPRVEHSGRTRLKFDLYTGLEDEYEEEHSRRLDVLILDRVAWDAREESMVRDGWKAQYIDDGRRVLAIRLTVRPRSLAAMDERRRRREGNRPDGDALACMKRLREHMLRAVSADPDIRYVSMQDGGDGQAVFHVEFGGIEPAGYVSMEFCLDEADTW